MAFACSIFNWSNKFNITMQMDASPESPYEQGMEYWQGRRRRESPAFRDDFVRFES